MLDRASDEFHMGRYAFHNNETINDNPYVRGTFAYMQWREGYEFESDTERDSFLDKS